MGKAVLRLIRLTAVSPSLWIGTLVGLCLFLCLLGVVLLARNLGDGLAMQASASSDNTQWTFAQLDAEYTQLTAALQRAKDRPQDSAANLNALRRQFDILYNRTTILREGSLFSPLYTNPLYTEGISALTAFLNRNVPLIDAADPDLQAALPQLESDLEALNDKIGGVITAGISAAAAYSDRQRHQIASNLIALGLLTGFMILVLVVLTVMLMRLNQSNNDRAQQIRMTLARTESIVTAAIDAVLVIDAKGLAVEFNPAAERMFGYPRAEILGRPVGFLFHKTQGNPDPDDLLQSVNAQHRSRRHALRRSGEAFPVELSVVEGRDPDGQIFVAYLRDLSDVVASAQALDQARDAAKAGARTQADLLAVMSHEMRTPLNGMMGMIELLQDTALSPDQKRFMRALQNSGEVLQQHVDDVLNIAKLDSGTRRLQITAVHLGDLVQEIFASQTATATAKGIRLRFAPTPDMPDLIQSDRFQLRQVLLNLIGNALKFTLHGEVCVTARHDAAQGYHELAVIDTGIGIEPEDRERVFDDFVTLDASYSRNSGGTGLGLGITRRIVHGLGGTVQAEPNPGGGSLFRVRLPCTPLAAALPAPAPAAPPAPSAVPPLRVLLAEDNEINRLLMRELLAKQGHSVQEAHDGEEAVQMAQAQGYDLILMDISMPRLDGIAACQRIRNTPGPNQTVPIVALTAHTLARDLDRMVAAGMTETLLKPITRQGLAALISRQRAAPVAADLAPQSILDLREMLGPDRFASTLRSFMAEVDSTLAAHTAAPTEALRRDLHKLTGAAAMLGAEAFAQILRRLQDACEADAPDNFAPLWQQMQTRWQSSRKAFEAAVQDQT